MSLTAAIPLAMQVIPLLPGAIEALLKIINVVRADPQTPAEAKPALEAAAERLLEAKRTVAEVPLVPVLAD